MIHYHRFLQKYLNLLPLTLKNKEPIGTAGMLIFHRIGIRNAWSISLQAFSLLILLVNLLFISSANYYIDFKTESVTPIPGAFSICYMLNSLGIKIMDIIQL